jgi:hypothetical protein
MVIKTIFIAFIWLAMLSSCQNTAGLRRMSFNNFNTKEYNTLGFSLEVPVQSNEKSSKYSEKVYDSSIFKQNSNTLGELSLAYHPIFGNHPLSEPVYLIEFSVAKLSQKQFELFKKHNHYLLNNPCYSTTSPKFSSDITESRVLDSFNRREYECRYGTVKLKNGDILVCLGRVLLDDEANLEVDIQQLRGMMHSITPLN